jgi:hypothetical protein
MMGASLPPERGDVCARAAIESPKKGFPPRLDLPPPLSTVANNVRSLM